MKKICILLCLMLVVITGCGEDASEIEISTVSSEEKETEAPGIATADKTDESGESEIEVVNNDTTKSPTTVYVYVCGAVASEGVYELPSGSRISDALEMAGGYSDTAIRGYVNLAKEVSDGERIYFPDESESQSYDLSESSSTDDTWMQQEGYNEEVSGLVNINTATVEELKTLSGIGDSKAADIVAYREQNGTFNSVEELMNVSGIGENTFNKLKPYITVK